MKEVLSMAADIPDGPCNPVAGMQPGTWVVTGTSYARGCSASQTPELILGAQLPEDCSTHEPRTTVSHVRFKRQSPVLATRYSSHLIDGWKRNVVFLSLPVQIHTHRGLHSGCSAMPTPHLRWARVCRLRPRACGQARQPAAHPWQGQISILELADSDGPPRQICATDHQQEAVQNEKPGGKGCPRHPSAGAR